MISGHVTKRIYWLIQTCSFTSKRREPWESRKSSKRSMAMTSQVCNGTSSSRSLFCSEICFGNPSAFDLIERH